jgi:putative transposase
MTPTGTRLLQNLPRSLLDPPRKLRSPSKTGGAADERISATA